MDFGGLRAGDAGRDEERAEQSEAGESAAFGLDVGIYSASGSSMRGSAAGRRTISWRAEPGAIMG